MLHSAATNQTVSLVFPTINGTALDEAFGIFPACVVLSEPPDGDVTVTVVVGETSFIPG